MIYRIETYVNDAGQAITAKYPMEGDTQFVAQALLNFNAGGQQGQLPFTFEVPGETIEEAFGNFDLALESGKVKAEVDLRRQIAESQRKVIAVPGMNGVPRF